MQTLNNVHDQFSDFFAGQKLRPFSYLLSKKLSEGHICLDLKEVVVEKDNLVLSYESVEAIESDLEREPLVSTSFTNRQPFVLYNSNLYIQRYFAYETLVLERIKKFIETESLEIDNRIKLLNQQRDFIDRLFSFDDPISSLPEEEKIDWQLIAAILGFLNNFTIITGGPGTGKTTTVSKVLELLKHLNPDIKVGLAAPTGKAAMRLAESLEGEQPTTIHRMLKSIHGTPHFKHNRDNPLNFDLVIIDEASMIDVALFAKLLDAIGPETRLILLGDKDQLASVEAGSLFRDLCQTQEQMNTVSFDKADLINSFIVDNDRRITPNFVSDRPIHLLSNHIIELKRSRRFDSQKGIGKLSKAVIYNRTEDLKELLKPNTESQIQLVNDYNPAAFKEFVNGYESYIQEVDIQKALKKFNDLRVLCAIREGMHGLYKINKLIEDELTSRRLIDTQAEFYENRPIIITKNYYDLGLYNGDIGIIRPDANNRLMAWFEDSDKNLRAILPGLIVESETVYAMTIHKSQGSEYNNILIVLPELEESQLLTRELLYTAITRAKSHVTIMGSDNILLSTINRSVKRASGIKERFNIKTQNT